MTTLVPLRVSHRSVALDPPTVPLAPVRPASRHDAASLADSLAAVLAEILGRDSVPRDADVFTDLDADSLLMARFCARVRKQPDLPSIAMRDVYEHPRITTLAEAFAAEPDAGPADAPIGTGGEGPESGPRAGVRRGLCGTVQLLLVLAWSWALAEVVVRAFWWTAAATTVPYLLGRSAVVGVAAPLALTIVTVAAKWVLIGRFTVTRFPVWGWTYLRFWIVRSLVRSAPPVLFGGPLYVLYLRALGARVGRGALLLSAHVPVCTDLLTVGEGAVVRWNTRFAGYRVVDGVVETGAVALGRHARVGENVVLDVDTALGDGAALDHASSLQPGQAVPAGTRWHGSPAVPTDVPYTPPTDRPGRPRAAAYAAAQLSVATAVATAGFAVLVLLLRDLPWLSRLLEPAGVALTADALAVVIVGVPSALFVLGLLAALVVAVVGPRMLTALVPAGQPHPVYGWRFLLHRAVVGWGNSRALVALFGDSSAIPHYLSAVGWRLRPLEQTGSNFGMDARAEVPALCSVGPGTVVADGLSMVNAEYDGATFRLGPARVGARNYLGNHVVVPGAARTGDDCLLATKVAVPVDGPVRSGTGLLGSPAFAIPRSVARDTALDLRPALLARRLRAKNRHNALTIALHLLVRWALLVLTAVITVLVATAPVALGAIELAAIGVGALITGVLWFGLVERLCVRLQVLAPDGRSIYDPAFWRHERFWKVRALELARFLDGTPWKSLVWRLLGVRVGARLFDDGVGIIEKTFVTLGDDVTLNEGSVLQCHSQEDGAFKSDRIVLGDGVTLGVAAFVHYGTVVGDDVRLSADTFLMKGEEVPAAARWGGNPARPLA